jgi:hypothetical protein
MVDVEIVGVVRMSVLSSRCWRRGGGQCLVQSSQVPMKGRLIPRQESNG